LSIAETVIQQTVQKAAKEATRKAVSAMSRKVYREVVKRYEHSKKSLYFGSSGKEIARQTAMKNMTLMYGKTLAEETAKALGQKLLGKVSYGSIQRALPLVSGAISGVMDMTYCRKVGIYAKDVFKQ
jgi:hypothetical protein